MKNDEIRMTNDESNPNDQMTNEQNHAPSLPRFSHSSFKHSNLIRHSSFVIRTSLAVIAVICGYACKVGPNYQRPDLHVSTTYKSETQPASWPATRPALGTNWWVIFDDEQLTALEEAATRSNPDLQAAMQRVIQAREAAKAVKSQFYPVITLNPSMTRKNTGSNALIGGGTHKSNYQIPFDLSYEVDLWGRIRRGYESSVAQAEASADAYFVLL